MKWLRENPFVAGLAAVTLVGAGVLGYFLSQFLTQYTEASEAYAQSVQKLQGLQNRVPFPNAENLEKSKQLETQYRNALTELQQNMAKMDIPLDPSIQPQQFQDDLRKAVNEIKEHAAANNVTLPSDFYLGFSQYANSLPEASAAPALARQLKVIRQLTERLIDLKVESIDSLERAKLPEERTASGGNQGGQQNRSSGGLHRFPFDIAFTADQGKFRVAFNSLLSGDQFLIVRGLSLQNTNPVGPPIARDNAGTGGSNTSPTPGASNEANPATGNLNVILGRELVKVALRIEMIDFPDAPEPKK